MPRPSGVLLQRANAASIAWDSTAQSFVDLLGLLPAWRLSAPELQMRLALMWQTTVQDRLSLRPTFAGLEHADPHATRLLLKTFSPHERSLLTVSLNGTFFTNDSLRHIGNDCDPACPFCGALDSLGHRFLQCPHFEDCRQGSCLSRAGLGSLTEAQALHAWVMRPNALLPVQRTLAQLQQAFDQFEPVPDLQAFDVFTDGSCTRPSTPALRLASWACCIALPGSPPSSLRLSRGLVPGLLQSASRAELCALVSAALFCRVVRRPVRVWSDCLGVIRKMRLLLDGSWTPGFRTRHADLWTLIAEVREDVRPFLTVHKVDSHLDPAQEPTFADEWCADHNHSVDAEAVAAQELRTPEFWTLWQQLLQECHREWHIGKSVMQLHVAVGRKATRTRPALIPTAPEPVSLVDVSPLSLGELPVNGRDILARRYGLRFVDAVVAWGSRIGQEPYTFRWVSNVQLFWLFAWTMALRRRF